MVLRANLQTLQGKRLLNIMRMEVHQHRPPNISQRWLGASSGWQLPWDPPEPTASVAAASLSALHPLY